MLDVLVCHISADDVGIKVLFKRLRSDRIHDISHKSSDLEYKLYG